MTNSPFVAAPTRFVDTGAIRFAYRRFGRSGGAPLVFLQYFNANLDGWDPAMIDGFAADREVILVDLAGVGGSGGQTPGTVAAMARDFAAFCGALHFKKIDLVGFSLGGAVAQQTAADYPGLLNRIILLGAGPRGGEGMSFTELSPEEQADPKAFLMAAFFTGSDASRAAGERFWERLGWRQADRDQPVTSQAAEAQLRALREWGAVPAAGRYAMLSRITHPVLIVHGLKEIVVPSVNAFILATHLPNAQLIMYPDANHGAHYQHGKLFLKEAGLFLTP